MGSRHTLSESCFGSTMVPQGPPNGHSWTNWSPSSAWQATDSSSLLPDQRGQLQLHNSQTRFPSCFYLSDIGRGGSNSANGTLSVMLGWLHTSFACWKESTGGLTFKGESEGSPGECYFWPFDPGSPGSTSWGHMDSLHSTTFWA